VSVPEQTPVPLVNRRVGTRYLNERSQGAHPRKISKNRSSDNGVDLYARHFRNYEAYQSFEPLLSNALE
jgi:hypothetical protein